MRERMDLGFDRHTDLPVEELSTKELVRDLIEHVKMLAQNEREVVRSGLQEGRGRLRGDWRTAKEELGAEVDKAKQGATAVSLGGVLCHAAVLFLLGALALGLWAVGLPLWACALIVGGVAGLVGGFLIAGGIDRFKRIHLTPERTIERIKEDRLWMNEKAHALTSRIRARA